MLNHVKSQGYPMLVGGFSPSEEILDNLNPIEMDDLKCPYDLGKTSLKPWCFPMVLFLFLHFFPASLLSSLTALDSAATLGSYITGPLSNSSWDCSIWPLENGRVNGKSMGKYEGKHDQWRFLAGKIIELNEGFSIAMFDYQV